jgi:tetratricopeptide (TPR) repeat protein
VSLGDARKLIEEEKWRLNLSADVNATLEAVRDALPAGSEGREIAPILPDMVGVAAILVWLGRGGQEAVDIYRRLAAAHPDAFLPDLAMSLPLGGRLSDLGRREEALAAAQEAVDIYRRLAAARPDAFLPDLAMSLSNLGGRLSDLGRREEALAAAQEGIQLFTQPFLKHPQAYASRMVLMRKVYLSICEATGREPDEALLTPIIEALQQMNSGSDA